MGGNEYLLRSRDREELGRLELQHRVWREQTDALVRRAGFCPGDRLLDLGCGPGFLSLDLAGLVGPGGSVTAVDGSQRFIDYLSEASRSRGLDWIRPELGDVRALRLEPGSLDGAICRWVLMFLDAPDRAVRCVARALRPGGVLAVMEYVQFRSISLWPSGAHFKRVYEAVSRLISAAHGDPDVGGHVPRLLVDAGLEILEIESVMRTGRPGSPLWEWLDATNANHRNLVEAGLLDQQELDAYYREWTDHRGIPGAFFTAPPVLLCVARKPA